MYRSVGDEDHYERFSRRGVQRKGPRHEEEEPVPAVNLRSLETMTSRSFSPVLEIKGLPAILKTLLVAEVDCFALVFVEAKQPALAPLVNSVEVLLQKVHMAVAETGAQ